MAGRFSEIKKELPVLGVGLGLRRQLADDTYRNLDSIDWLEIAPENYMEIGGMARELLDDALSRFPMISHGLNLSIGSTDPINKDYLKSLKKLLDEINAPWWSDHLCFTSVEGIYMHDLLPLPFSREAVNHVSEKVKQVQDFIGRPFLLENISFYMQMPGQEMNEAQFLAEVLEKADCGLLLDVNNVYVNSVNHKFDAEKYFDAIPLDRTVQIHVAGHKRGQEIVIDTHGAAVIEPVYDLLRYVLEKTSVNGVMLERDQNFPEFQEILDELAVIRRIASEIQPQLAMGRNVDKRDDDKDLLPIGPRLATGKQRGRSAGEGHDCALTA